MERTGIIAIGDWSYDGHGKFNEVEVHMTGEDVTNKRLKAAYQEAVDAVGVDVAEIFSAYEKSNISFEDLKKICESGYKIHLLDPEVSGDEPIQTWEIFDEIPEEWYVDKEKDDDLISAAHMLMFYLGYGIKDFAYEFVKSKKDYIIGQWTEDAPVSSFGYGLFY